MGHPPKSNGGLQIVETRINQQDQMK